VKEALSMLLIVIVLEVNALAKKYSLGRNRNWCANITISFCSSVLIAFNKQGLETQYV
jgi:hypothetical protein